MPGHFQGWRYGARAGAQWQGRVHPGDQSVRGHSQSNDDQLLANQTEKARPVLERIIEDVMAGRVRAVAGVAIDRLGRSMLGILQVVDRLARAGVVVVSIREPWVDTGGTMGEILRALAG
ncbi:recombinase family protein [Stigmatella erecta]|uniref:recombinase family protein n=1 Tax=Stigmatella erecta TaxID=83460 RepID=UPI001160451D|nr:recombinase family protein [Stigmatella erecta]